MVVVEPRRLEPLLGHIQNETRVVGIQCERPPRNGQQLVADTEKAAAREHGVGNAPARPYSLCLPPSLRGECGEVGVLVDAVYAELASPARSVLIAVTRKSITRHSLDSDWFAWTSLAIVVPGRRHSHCSLCLVGH